jgi:hypothetical protein
MLILGRLQFPPRAIASYGARFKASYIMWGSDTDRFAATTPPAYTRPTTTRHPSSADR